MRPCVGALTMRKIRMIAVVTGKTPRQVFEVLASREVERLSGRTEHLEQSGQEKH